MASFSFHRTEPEGRSCSPVWRVVAVIGVAAFVCLPLSGQPTVVESGHGHSFVVNGEPFFPLGWNAVGNCVEGGRGWDREALYSELERLRDHKVNLITEPPAADGRLIPLVLPNGHENWYNYQVLRDGEIRWMGHPRPGVYVAGLRRQMDRAYNDGVDPIYVIAAIMSFVIPQGTIPPEWTQPFEGNETVSCAQYRQFIEHERSQLLAGGEADLAARMPEATCPDQALPFWEWNLRYVVHGLRDHPGFFGWMLWDEPEDPSHFHYFGGFQPEEAIPPYTGPESLPTPDLLRYVFNRIKSFEVEGQGPDYQRRPIIVDIFTPDLFFSNRFPWSSDGTLRPRIVPGPFDRTPDGDYHIPADVLGLEASSMIVQSSPSADFRGRFWFQDHNDLVRRGWMLREAAEADDVFATFVIAAQGQVTNIGPAAVDEPTRCPGYYAIVRPLNDRDLVWHMLSLQVVGMRGHVFYSQHLMPTEGPGAEQFERSTRLLKQFSEASLDSLFLLPEVLSGWTLDRIEVRDLTNYLRSDPTFVGPAYDFDPGISAAGTFRGTIRPEDYVLGVFGRSDAADAYGQATTSPPPIPGGREGFALLRTAVRTTDDHTYVIVVNLFDARISARYTLSDDLRGTVTEGRFDLDPGGEFRWDEAPARLSFAGTSPSSIAVDLEPYEARVIRFVRP